MNEEIRIGVSACLLGERVRYDGGHKRDRWLTGTLARFVRFVPVCPEADIGLGTPREPIEIRRERGTLRLVGIRSGDDHTAAMRAYARKRVRQLSALGLCGYVLKSGSPSCGMERVPIHASTGKRIASGRGFFADELLSYLTAMPVEEEARLDDAASRESFIERVLAYHRLRAVFAKGWRRAELVRFHERQGTLLLAHDPEAHAALGRMITAARSRRGLAERYATALMNALPTAGDRRRLRVRSKSFTLRPRTT